MSSEFVVHSSESRKETPKGGEQEMSEEFVVRSFRHEIIGETSSEIKGRAEFVVKGKTKGGEQEMSKELIVHSSEIRSKTPKGGFMRIVLGLLLVVMSVGAAGAITTDSILLTITPVFNLSVNISSATGTFGSSINLASSKTICVGRIENDGNVSSKWQKLASAAAQAASGPWTLKTSGTPVSDEFRLLAITTGIAVSPDWCPAGTSFLDSCIDGVHTVTGVTASPTDLTEGGVSAVGPAHTTGETKSLWVSIMMPNNITSGEEQTITLSVQAVAP